MASQINLAVSIDVGGSGTKIIYKANGWKEPQLIVMSPEVEQITKADFQRYQDNQVWNGMPLPEHQAYLEWQDSIFIVGEFALEFAAVDRIHERKYENALYKVLAAVGVILQKHNVAIKKRNAESPKIILDLAFLLPWNEYNDHKRFFSQLQQMFKAFKFRGQAWDITLSENFLCRPEGAGLLGIYTKTKGVSWFQQNQVAILMLGHRNTTLLCFDKGIRKSADSPLLGFSSLLDDVCSRVSGIVRDQLAQAIFDALSEAKNEIYEYESPYMNTKHPNWRKLKAIQMLATARDESLRQRELEDIVVALVAATNAYWLRLKKWLEKNLQTWPKQIIIGGGAAAFIEPELEHYFNCVPCGTNEKKLFRGERAPSYRQKTNYSQQEIGPYAQLVWLSEINEQIERTFKIGFGPNQGLAFRLIDCFGMMDQLLDKTKEVVKSDKSEKTA
ncbi:ParM/StbA family protein [Nostoc sp. C110]|uniref:ParM/StbA family protein n=1 Tax=Nostoc sp. C110 TaxID=3349876 RepID=UPI00370D535D